MKEEDERAIVHRLIGSMGGDPTAHDDMWPQVESLSDASLARLVAGLHTGGSQGKQAFREAVLAVIELRTSRRAIEQSAALVAATEALKEAHVEIGAAGERQAEALELYRSTFRTSAAGRIVSP